MYNRSKDLFLKLEHAVNSLNEAIELVSENTDYRYMQWLKDSVIQRFEYCTELSWKFMKYYILEEYWENVSFPKEIIKSAYKAWLIENLDIWIDMIEKRNRLSHDYHEEFANLSFDDIIDYIINEINNFISIMKKNYE